MSTNIGVTFSGNASSLINSLSQIGQSVTKLQQSLQTSVQNMQQFSSAVDKLDGPLQSAGQGMGDLGDNMEGLDKSLDSSAGAMGDLGDATDEMSDAVEGVGDSVGEAAQGFEELNDGAENAQNSLGEVSDSIDGAAQGLDEMSTGLEDTGTGFETMNTGIEDANTGLTDMTTVVEESNTGLADMTTAVEDTTTGLTDMTTGVEDSTTGIEELGTGIEDAGTGFEDFGTSISDATSGLEGFDEGIGDTGAGVSVLSGSFDDAADSSEGFSGALTNMDAPLQGVNGGLTTGNTLTTNLAGSTKTLGGSFTNLGVSMAGISGAAVGLFNAYDNIGDAAIAVEGAHAALIKTQARSEIAVNNLDKAMEDLNKKYGDQITGLAPLNEAYAKWKSLVDQNITSGAEYDKALQNLKAAQEAANGTSRDAEQALTALGGKLGQTESALIRTTVATNNEDNAKEAYNQTLLETATSIIPSVILGLSGLKGAHEAVGKVVKGMPGAFNAFKGALAGLPALFSGIGSAISTSMIPALAAAAPAIAIGVLAIGAFVTSMEALRATLPFWDQIGAAIGNAIPQSVGFLNALRQGFIDLSNATNSSVSTILGGLDQLTGGGLKLKEGFDKWTATLPDAEQKAIKLNSGITVLNTGVTGLNASLVMQKGTFQEYNGNLKDMDNNMVALAGNWHKNADGAAVVTKAYGDNSSAAAENSAATTDITNTLKPYVPLAQNAAGATDAQALSAKSAEQMNVALAAALKGDTTALANFITGANSGATSATDLGVGAEEAATGVEGITPAATDAGQATLTFDEQLKAAAASTDPFVAGVAQAAIQLREEAKEADNTLVKNKTLLAVWGVEIPAAIANDVNAIQALVNVERDEHSAMDTTLIKADEVILKYGDIEKAAKMTRDEKIKYAAQLEETAKATEKDSKATEENTDVLKDNAEAIKKSKDELLQYVEALSSGVPQAQAFEQGQIKANQSLVDLILKVSEASGELSTYGELLASGRESGFLFAEGQQVVYKSILDNISQIINLEGQIQALNATMAANASIEFSKGLVEGTLAATKLTTEIAKANGEWKGFRDTLIAANPQLQKFGDLSQFTNEQLSSMAQATKGSREAIHALVEAFMEGAASFNDFVSSIDFREIDDKVKEGVDKFRESLDDMVSIAQEQGVHISDEFVASLDFDNAIQTAADIMSQFWPTIEAAVATGNPDFIVQGIDLFTSNVKHALEDADLPAAAQAQIGGIMAEIEKLKTIKDPVELLTAMQNIKTKVDALKDGKSNLEGMTTALSGLTNVTPGNMTQIAQSIADMAEAASLLKLSPAQIDAWAQSLSQLTGAPVDQLKAALETKMQETGTSATSKLMEAGPGGDASRAALAQQMVALAAVFQGFQTDVGNVFINLETIFNAFVGVAQTFATSVSGAFSNTMINASTSMATLATNMQTLIAGFAILAQASQSVATTISGSFSNMAANSSASMNTMAGNIALLGVAMTLLLRGSQVMATTVSGSFNNMRTNAVTSLTTLKSNMTTAQTAFTTFQRAAQTMATTVSGAFSNMASNAASSLSKLKSDVSSTMSSITSSMNQATSAAKSLQSAINALQSKTITITTVYRTVGRPGLARGGAFVSSSPSTIGGARISEFGHKELVTVTPLETPGRQPVKGLSEAIEGMAAKKGRRAMDEVQEAPARKKELVMMRETPIIIQVDGREIARVVNRRIFEGSDNLV